MNLVCKIITVGLLTVFYVLFSPLMDSNAGELSPGLHKTVFSNGLTAIVKESHRAPVAAVQVWVKAGSAHETDSEAGITHFIEHMIFKGTGKRGPGEIAREIESVGGSINAYTSFDYTVYHCTVPRQFLGTALEILSDAIFNSVFDEKEIKKEKRVVLEEISMRRDTPGSRLANLLMKTAYGNYPYGRAVIGFEKTVKSLERDTILSYISRRYNPSGMAVVVAGDVDADRALIDIRKAFGAAKSRKSKEFVFPSFPSQKSPAVAIENMDIKEGYLALAFSGLPGFNAPEVPALDILAALLGAGDSSRLTANLKDRLQIVHSIEAYAFTPAGSGLFEITATLDPEKSIEVINRILQEVYRIAEEGVLDEELERAKIHVETEFVYSQETMSGEARKLGVFETLAGNPYAEKLYLEKVRDVTPADIRKAANRFFRKDNINVAMVMPENHSPEITGEQLAVMAQDAVLYARGIEEDQTVGILSPLRKTRLSNGLTLLIREAPETPTVALRLVFPGGVRYETRKDNGIFNFMARAWTKGTETRSAQAIAESIEGMGGTIIGFSGRNTFGLQGRFLSRNLDQGLALFSEILLTPTFPDEETDKLRSLIVAQIKRQDDYLPGVTIREFRRLLFSPHPYGMNILGDPVFIQSVTSSRLKSIYSGFVLPERGILSIVGDVDAENIIETMEVLLEGWTATENSPLASPSSPDPLTSPRVLTLKRETNQTHLVLGFPGTTFTSADRYTLEILNAILSGQGGRLFINLRDKESLAYSVTSFNALGLDYGAFGLYIACAPEKKDQALKGIWKEIYRLKSEPVHDRELERAKKWVVGSHEIGLQTNGAQAMDMALNHLYGLGYNFSARYSKEIGKVTAEQVQEAAERIFNSQAYVLVRVGP